MRENPPEARKGKEQVVEVLDEEAEVEPFAAPPLRVALAVGLLDQFQYCLLGLVCLLKSCHTGGLQDVVLGHVRHRLADVSILHAVDALCRF